MLTCELNDPCVLRQRGCWVRSGWKTVPFGRETDYRSFDRERSTRDCCTIFMLRSIHTVSSIDPISEQPRLQYKDPLDRLYNQKRSLYFRTGQSGICKCVRACSGQRQPTFVSGTRSIANASEQVRQALGLGVVLLFVAGLLALVLLVEWLEHYLEDDLGLS